MVVKEEEQERFEIMPEEAPFEPGFNMKTLWAALFVGFVMLPGAIYLGLVTGQSMAGGAEWVTLILFIEIAKRTFVRLRTQEIIILYWVAGGLVLMGGKLGTGADLFGGPFGVLIWDQYLIQSPQADGLAEHIPNMGCSAAWLRSPIGTQLFTCGVAQADCHFTHGGRPSAYQCAFFGIRAFQNYA